jgi:hypothetical protein
MSVAEVSRWSSPLRSPQHQSTPPNPITDGEHDAPPPLSSDSRCAKSFSLVGFGNVLGFAEEGGADARGEEDLGGELCVGVS